MSSEPSDTFDTSVSRCGCPDADPQRKDPHLLPRIRHLLPLSKLRQVSDHFWGKSWEISAT
jgi:hypothetical protein